MKKNTKLYNMILPPYMLMTFHPLFVMISLAGNFIIDSVVLIIVSLAIFKRMNLSFYKSTVLKVWLLGYAGDLAGAAYLLIGGQIGYAFSNFTGVQTVLTDGLNNVTNHASELNAFSYMFIGRAVIIAAAAIFLLDFFVAFKKSGLTIKQRALASLTFAVLTAPYTFFIPNSFFYSFM